MPDVPALSLALVGAFALLMYYESTQFKYAALFFAATTFAMLLKISAGIFLCAALIVLISTVLQHKPFYVTKQQRTILLLGVVAIAVNAVWVLFAKWYNTNSGTGQNLLGLLPIWDADSDEIVYIAKRVFSEWSKVILHPVAWTMLLACILFTVWHFKSLQRTVRQLLFWISIGTILYGIAWYRPFLHHDYYLINPFIILIAWLIAGLMIIDKWSVSGIRFIGVLAAGWIVLSSFHCRSVQYQRYYDNAYNNLQPSLFTVEPYLRSLGINRTDRVVSVPDPSPNITLYYLNQPGWTEAFNSDAYNMHYFVDLGARYLILHDSSYAQLPLYEPYTTDLLGAYHNIQVYRIPAK